MPGFSELELTGYLSDGRLKIIGILQIRNSDCKMTALKENSSGGGNITDFEIIN
jgi:hypothetical protein